MMGVSESGKLESPAQMPIVTVSMTCPVRLVTKELS